MEAKSSDELMMNHATASRLVLSMEMRRAVKRAKPPAHTNRIE